MNEHFFSELDAKMAAEELAWNRGQHITHEHQAYHVGESNFTYELGMDVNPHNKPQHLG